MAVKKKSSRQHMLLWVGLRMIGAALVLTLMGALVFGSGGNVSSPFRMGQKY